MRKQFIKEIMTASNLPNTFQYLEDKFLNIEKKVLLENLIQFGILPEQFDHDSSEEKNWAKLSDIILAACFNYLGINSDVLRTRGDSADVFGKCIKYSVVADAKTFRLSRTAKNQKDFKVKSLHDWRKDNNYAVLAAPMSQYLTNKSQIYNQAIEKNVTFISYLHLKILIENNVNCIDLIELFNVGNSLKLKTIKEERNKAKVYWDEVNRIVCKISKISELDFQKYKLQEMMITKEIGNEGLDFWNKKINYFKSLPKQKAIDLLIKSEKIDNKITTIKKAINSKINLI